MKRSRRCKIVATLGPASNDEAMIEKLWRAGADLFRINMSHTDPAGMRERVAMIRAVEAKVGRPSASWSICRGRNCASARSRTAAPIWSRARNSCSIPTRPMATPPACACRIPKFSRACNPATDADR